MHYFKGAAFAAILMSTATAGAQGYSTSSLPATARSIYQSCAQVAGGSSGADVRASCACITGYMGGAMSDRDFEVVSILLRVGEMTELGASEAAIQAEIMAFFERGFTEADVQRVSAMVDQIGARGDAGCGQFEQKPSV